MTGKRLLILAVILAAAASPSRAFASQDPYLNGQLVHAAFIELAGTPSEIAEIRAYGAKQGWTVDCEGHAGAQDTLRLRFPAGTQQSAIETYFYGDIRHLRGSKSQMIYSGMKRSKNCILLP